MRKTLRITLGITIAILATSMGFVNADSNINNYNPLPINVTDSSTGRYSSITGYDEVFYVDTTSGYTSNLYRMTMQISSFDYSGKTYKPYRMEYRFFTNLYGYNGNPVSNVLVSKGSDYVGTTHDVQISYEVSAGVSEVVEASVSAGAAYTLSDYTHDVTYLGNTGLGNTFFYDKTWYPAARGIVNVNNPSTQTLEINDAIALGILNNPMRSAGSIWFDIWGHFEYKWIATYTYSCGFLNLFTCSGTAYRTYNFDMQMGRPGLMDGNSGADAEITKQIVQSSTPLGF